MPENAKLIWIIKVSSKLPSHWFSEFAGVIHFVRSACIVVCCCVHTSQIISLWMVDDSDVSVHTTYLQHTYTRECIVIGVVTHSQIYYSAMIFMQCIWWLLIEIILHTHMKLFSQDDFIFHFSKKSK